MRDLHAQLRGLREELAQLREERRERGLALSHCTTMVR
jgi:hypothetical protein